MKRRWPPGVEKNPSGDPLLDAVGFTLSAADQHHQLARHDRRWAEWLLTLRRRLTARFGPRWWTALDLDPPPGEPDDDPATT
jgi:hypothetical protein